MEKFGFGFLAEVSCEASLQVWSSLLFSVFSLFWIKHVWFNCYLLVIKKEKSVYVLYLITANRAHLVATFMWVELHHKIWVKDIGKG